MMINMEENSNGLISLLNDLIQINRDRAAGYQKAIGQLGPTDIDLKTMFVNMANHSAEFSEELSKQVVNLGGEAESDPSKSGEIYRVWRDFHAGMTERDRKSIISRCEFGEDAALRAYQSAVAAKSTLPVAIRQIIDDQYANIRAAHDVVKRYRDMQEAIDH